MTEKELQAIYEAIMNKEVEKAKELIDSIYLTRERVLQSLKKYSRTKSMEEQKIYEKEYTFFLVSYCDYFKIAISLINELIENGSVDFNEYSSFGHVKDALKRFKNKLPEYSIYVDAILKQIELEKQKTRKKLKIEDFYKSHYTGRSKYEDEFYIVVTSDNPINIFHKFNWSEKNILFKIK